MHNCRDNSKFTCIHAKVITYVPFVTTDPAYHDTVEFTWTPVHAAPAPETSGSGNASSSTGPAPAVPLEVIDEQCEVEIDDAEPGCDFAPSPAEISRLKAEAVSTKQLLTHLPKNKYCETCRLAKAKRTHRRDKKNRADASPPPQQFGEQCTADHVFSANIVSQGIGGQKYAVMM